jgi:peptidyl-prolyl cis-trans isomerase D
MIEKLDLKNSALEAIIQKKLLLLEAEKQNIHISDAELADRIMSNPNFQKDDQFSRSIYERFLTYNRMSAQDFEKNQRQLLLMEKVEGFIKDNTHVSDAEVEEALKKENRKIKIKYAEFPKDYYQSQITPTDEQLQQYYEAHKREFEVPVQIKVQYVKLTPDEVQDDIKVYEEDIKDYYENNKADYFVPKRYKAKHILFRAEGNFLPGEEIPVEEKEKQLNEAEAKAKARAEEILKKIKEEGASFEEMAKKHSDDKMSGKNGGDLGQFAKGTMVSEFEAALDTMKPGEISEPVKTPFGYHLIQLNEVHEQRIKPIDEVKAEIIEKLKEMKARQRIRRITKKMFSAAQKDNDLARATVEYDRSVKTTEFFSAKDHDLEGIGTVPEFYNTAFTLQDNIVSAPINTFEASFLIKVIERKPPFVPELQAVRDEVKEAFLQQRHHEVTKAKFEILGKELDKNPDLAKIAEGNSLVVDETPYFSQVDSIPGVGDIKSIKSTIFQLKPGETATGESPRAYYLIKVVDLQKPDEPTKEEIRETYKRLKKEKANIVFRNWLEQAKVEANIMVDKTLL